MAVFIFDSWMYVLKTAVINYIYSISKLSIQYFNWHSMLSTETALLFIIYRLSPIILHHINLPKDAFEN